MGYYTRFDLSVEEGDYNSKEIIDYMAIEYADNGAFYPFCDDFDCGTYGKNGCLYLESGDECKWYDHEEELKMLSTKFQDVVFVLHGEGEETGDMWYKYFKNGKMQECYARIEFDEYDENELR